MAFSINPEVASVIDPPMAEVASWLDGSEICSKKPLLDLSQAVPSYPPAQELRDHLASAVNRPETARYTSIAGDNQLRHELARRLSAMYHGHVECSDCFITAGCNQAFCVALQAIASPGDEVILPLPYYFNHQMWLTMSGIRDVHLPFRADRDGEPDPEDALRRITPRTRAIVLVTPNNPTGAVCRPETVRAFYKIARERGIALVLDETYRDFLAPEHPPHETFGEPDWRDTLVHLYSFSKAFALAGYRVGAIVGGDRLLAAVARIMDTVAICAPAIGQQAALFGMRFLADWVADKRQLVAERRRAIKDALAASRTGFRVISSGPYFVYVEHPFSRRSAADVARELAVSQHLLTVPGSVFGPGQERHLRLAFANVPAVRMTEVVDRLDQVC